MPKASKAAAANEDLPPGWEARDHQGKIVYINHATRTTQWKKPKVKKSKGKPPGSPWSSNSSNPMPAANPNVENVENESRPRNIGNVKKPTDRNTSTPTSALEPLPSGWESKVIKGNVVYIDHINKITTYDRPVMSPTSKPPSADGDGENKPLGRDRRVDNSAVERPLSGSSSGSGPSKMKNSGDYIGSGRVRQTSRPATGSGLSAVRKAPNVAASPLPEGWTRSVTAQGEVYYVNHVHKTTTWMRPTLKDEDEEPTYTRNPAEPESSARSSKGRRGYFDDPLEPPLPPGWEARMFEEGRVFYINHNDETTHWERPDPPEDYRPNVAVGKEAKPRVSTTHASRLAPNHTPTATAEEEHFGVNEGRMATAERRANAVPYEPVIETREREADTAMMSEPPLGTYEDTLAKAEASVSAALLSGRHSDRAPSTTVADSNDVQAEGSTAVSEPAGNSDEIYSTASIPKETKPISVSPREENPSPVSGGTGFVSAISKSGVFGPTVRRTVTAGENGRYAGSNGQEKTSRTASPPADADADGDGDGKSVTIGASKKDDDELPEGWVMLKVSDGGKVYYQNSKLKCTQWERPQREVSRDTDTDTHKTDAVTQMESTTCDTSSSGRGAGVEAGWEKVVTADGKPYYQNVITRITSWDPPVGWKETSPSVETTSVAHALFENKGDVHEETAKALSSERGDKTDGSPEATAFQMENSREDLSAGPQDPPDPPLPPGWEKLYTDDGVPFWTNHNDQTTSWDPPPGIPSEAIDASQTSPKDTRYAETEDSSVEASSRPVSGSNFPCYFDANGRKLPEGWEMLTTDQGVVYYVDHINKRTCWDPPQMSSGGQSVLDTGRPDIPPAELVPDSADLYTGADLLNRFFESWVGDARSKSPLEAARNVIVTHLAGPGLKAKKSRNRSSVSRVLYFGPDNKQIVWVTNASSRGKYSRKGMTLESIIQLQSEDGGIKVEMRGEEPITLKSEAVETLTSEGASILLGVLLADMTGSVLRLTGLNGGNPCSYYPASFVEKVLKVRQVRQARKEKKIANVSASPASQDVLKHSSEASMDHRAEARPNSISVSNGGPSSEMSSKSSNLKELAQADNARVETAVVHPENNGGTNEAVGKGAELYAQAAEDAGDEDTEQDQEEEEYRRVLDELLRPVKLERYVDAFVASEITLDILPLVERSDLENVVGIESAVSQLKIIRQIKKRFPNGVL